MPDIADDIEPRFRLPPAVTLLAPVLISLAVQVPATIAILGYRRSEFPRGAGTAEATAIALIAIALVAASALALLAARRWPGPTVAVVAALTLVDVFTAPDASPPFVALAFAIVGAIVRGARVWAIAAVGAGWLTAIVAAGVQDVAWHPFRIAVTTLGLAACFAIGEAVRARRLGAARRRAQAAERRRTAEQDERDRIARELHDVLAHSLSQISVQSGMGLHLFDREPERAREALRSIRGLSANGLDEVRGVLAVLRAGPAQPAAPLTPQPQLDDLAPLVESRSGLGLTVQLADELAGDRPPSAVQTAAYRIAQEALTNVVRHSAATHAWVAIRRLGDELVLTVGDDGDGMPGGEGLSEGSGIRGMRERAHLAGGTFVIGPGERRGTVVTARLPWRGPS